MMKDEVVSYTLDPKDFSPAFLVIEEHAHYMNMCAIEIFILIWFSFYLYGLFDIANCFPGFLEFSSDVQAVYLDV